MNDRECITIRIEEYEEMIFQYFDALDQISDLELGSFRIKGKVIAPDRNPGAIIQKTG